MFCLVLYSFLYFISSYLPLWAENMVNIALPGVPLWIEHQPANEGSPVRFPVRALAWAADQVPSWGCMQRNHTLIFLSLSPFLAVSLKVNE